METTGTDVSLSRYPFKVPLIPPVWTSGDVFSGFQSQSRHPYSHLRLVHSLRFTSGATPADPTIPHMHVSAEVRY